MVLIIGAIVVIILVKNNFDKNNTGDNQQNTDVERQGEKKAEDDTGDNSGGDEASKQEEKAPQYDGDSPNKSETLTGMITYANVVDGELVMRINIDQLLQSGNCNLTMSRNGITYYTQSVAIQESVTTSTCDGYKIPVSELPKGNLSVEIMLDSDGKTGKITGKVSI